jgi:hypothetical protein
MKAKIKDLQALSTGNLDGEQPTTLEQVWGKDNYSVYGESTLEEYEASINSMNKTDLYSHAARRGIVPVGQRALLIKKLRGEYIKFHNSLIKAPKSESNIKEIPQKVFDILSEGR